MQTHEKSMTTVIRISSLIFFSTVKIRAKDWMLNVINEMRKCARLFETSRALQLHNVIKKKIWSGNQLYPRCLRFCLVGDFGAHLLVRERGILVPTLEYAPKQSPLNTLKLNQFHRFLVVSLSKLRILPTSSKEDIWRPSLIILKIFSK